MKQPARITPNLVLGILLILVLMNGAAIAWLGLPSFKSSRSAIFGEPTPASAAYVPEPSNPGDSLQGQAEPTQTPTANPIPLEDPNPGGDGLQEEGVLLLSLRDGRFTHLFAYHPGHLNLTRLTYDNWDEIHPTVSPDGTRLAYSSNQSGFWDLYLRDLITGEVQQITFSPAFDGSPSWSPDGQWLAYETYQNDNLDIYLKSVVDLSQEPIPLTEDPAADRSPSWSPGGRQIAFISDQSGSAEVWVADLDVTDERFSNVSNQPDAVEMHPAWSPDGRYLAWASQKEGEHLLLRWDSGNPGVSPIHTGYGDWPAWSISNDLIFTAIAEPNQTSLGAYQVSTGAQGFPAFRLPGAFYGMDWAAGPLSGWLMDNINVGDQSPMPALVQATITVQPGSLVGRLSMVPIEDVTAPVAMINDAVDEAFNALRGEAAYLSGWDVLSSLENAFVPLTTPPDPSIQEDWLYTGRAFSLNPNILTAGWMAAVREDFNGRTYWRLYLKTRAQDGSAGMPLDQQVWDLNARYSGDPAAYDAGGVTGAVPRGYWLDMTELASRFGWERLPARPNWRFFFRGVRFNQFVMRDGLDWNQAMAQLYPPEALATVTSIPTYTNTPTPTLVPTRTRVPSRTPTFTRTPTSTASPPATASPLTTLTRTPAPSGTGAQGGQP